MSRTFEISGKRLLLFFIGVSMAVPAVLLADLVLPLDSLASVALAALIGALLLATTVGLWRWETESEWKRLGTDEDITWDPIAHPGQAAKHRWEKAVRRLPGGDDEED
ncbi:hypothetical protein [Halorussus halophilus]|uniref:hypothetical protein n=1 Tax=Halorussus halophilus TaxID=2650975 RepID=UPI0013012074|nr:hypothetical protein [Halorussus halophilus]